MTSFLVPQVLKSGLLSEYQVQMVDMAPSQFVANGLLGTHNVCIHIGELDWPSTWYSESCGDMLWDLLARANHPLLQKKLTKKRILSYPFTYPIYLTREGLSHGDDGFHIPVSERRLGTKTTSALSAIETVLVSDELGFFPRALTDGYLKSKKARRLHMESWVNVTKPVYLSVKSEQISQKCFVNVKAALGKIINLMQ